MASSVPPPYPSTCPFSSFPSYLFLDTVVSRGMQDGFSFLFSQLASPFLKRSRKRCPSRSNIAREHRLQAFTTPPVTPRGLIIFFSSPNFGWCITHSSRISATNQYQPLRCCINPGSSWIVASVACDIKFPQNSVCH